MSAENSNRQPVLDTLARAGAQHARHRGLAFALRAAVWLVVAIPVLMVADVLFHFSDALRLVGLLGVSLAVVVMFGIALAMACFVRPPVLRMARLLESRNPELGSKLVNILQLDAESASEDAAPLTRELARRAVADAGNALDLPKLPPLARDPQLGGHAKLAFGALAVLLALSLFGGHHVRQEWLRFLDPFGDHPPFSLTRLDILKPAADAKILYGESCMVEVRAAGHQPRELFVTATPVGGDGSPVTLPMSSRGDGTFVVRLETIRNPLEIFAHTRDSGTRSHRVLLDLILTPQVGTAVVKISPPDYTGQKAREIPYRFSALQILEGSRVEFGIESNRPLGEGTLAFENGGDALETIPLTPTGDHVHAEFTAEKSSRLTFSLVDLDGNHATETPTASLTVTKDLPPAIELAAPEADALIVEGFAIPLTLDASDDYGLRTVRLHIGINDTFQPVESIPYNALDTKRDRISRTLDPASLGAKAGDRVTLFAEAVDTRPEPQMTRTATRHMEVITEADYNNRLREQVDVAMIAGKYEALIARLEEGIAEQKRIEDELAALREKAADDPEVAKALENARADQAQLNKRLEELADDLANFGRDNPVYDFEKELQEKLRQEAAAIRESVAQNRQDGGAPDQPPSAEKLQLAAQAQRERLQGGGDRARDQIEAPLEELAQLHELIKDFTRFKDLADKQKEIAEQTKAYSAKPQLNAEDRLALRELGARQREMAPKLDELARKLRHDAKAAAEKFPEAADSANDLAAAMESAEMPGLARQSATSLMAGLGREGQAQAQNLHDEMEALFEDVAECQAGVGQCLNRSLRLTRGMNPGDSLRQMMLSKNFRPLPSQAQGGTGMGAGGEMATAMGQGSPLLLGGEALIDGQIAASISGQGDSGGRGSPGAPTARLDTPDLGDSDQKSSRRTATPESGTLLLQYENIADAYFRRLTTAP